MQMAREIVKASHCSSNQGAFSSDVVGDFGLATSSLAAVDPSDVSLHVATPDADMTLGGSQITATSGLLTQYAEVGTRLYIAPEVQSKKRGPRNHSKADLYSLGVGLAITHV